MLITEMPENVVPISSGLFTAPPRHVIVLPVLFEGQVKAVIELASLGGFTDLQLSFLEQLTTSIGIVLNSIEATMQTEGLLKQSQQLATELQTQQRELQQTNEKLEQKAQQLADRNVEVEAKNQEIEQARRAVEEKATELALTSKYKSEFLANMSHELRTPLNSILILGQQLTENPDGNLTGKQVEFARTIHGAGTDLLNLISDILDLSKIESGTVSVDAEEVYFSNLLEMIARPFRHEAENRRLHFEVALSPNLERSIITDSKRLQQVLKNLLSNAFKFTAEGGVQAHGVARDERLERGSSDPAPRALGGRFRGVRYRHRHPAREAAHHLRGLPAGGCRHQPQVRRHRARARDQPRARQSARRRDPAAQHARRRQHVHPVSAASPISGAAAKSLRRTRAEAAQPAAASLPARAAAERPPEQILDDRNKLEPGDSVVLIVEDDPHYARIMMAAAQGRRDSRCWSRSRGADALALAREHHPTAISLDIFLPDMLGWTVLSQLKQDPATRHIPVQIVTLDEDRHHGLARGAFSFVQKPTTTRRTWRAPSRASRATRLRAASACCWSRTTRPSARASRNCWATTTSRSRGRYRRRGARAAARTTRSIAWCST